jgi:hypothetical protein
MADKIPCKQPKGFNITVTSDPSLSICCLSWTDYFLLFSQISDMQEYNPELQHFLSWQKDEALEVNVNFMFSHHHFEILFMF